MSVGKYEDLMRVFALRSGLPQCQRLEFEHLVVRNVFCFVFPDTLILGAVLFRGLGLGQDQHQDPAGGSLVPGRGGWAMPEPRLSAGEHLCRAWSWWASPLLALVSSLRLHTQSRVTAEVVADEDEDVE